MDQDGRLQSNPARAAILGVVDACRDRLGVRVGHEDVRLTLRCKNSENASSLPPKFLDGVDTAATVFYYDVYVPRPRGNRGDGSGRGRSDPRNSTSVRLSIPRSPEVSGTRSLSSHWIMLNVS